MAKIRGLQDVAEKRGQTLSQMALNWVLKDHEVTSVLVGASCPSQLVENATKISLLDVRKRTMLTKLAGQMLRLFAPLM